MKTPGVAPRLAAKLGRDLGYNATEIRQRGALFRPAGGGVHEHFSSQAFCRGDLYADGCGIPEG
jgi:hypothetical protein